MLEAGLASVILGLSLPLLRSPTQVSRIVGTISPESYALTKQFNSDSSRDIEYSTHRLEV